MSVTTVMVMVASTLISGLTPRRSLENTTMGRVLLPGPEVKLEITRSSEDRVMIFPKLSRVKSGPVAIKRCLVLCSLFVAPWIAIGATEEPPELGGQCAEGPVEGQHITTDCSI